MKQNVDCNTLFTFAFSVLSPFGCNFHTQKRFFFSKFRCVLPYIININIKFVPFYFIF